MDRKIAYITSVVLNSEDAQSIQVIKMSEAFAKKLNSNFFLVGMGEFNGDFFLKKRVPQHPRVLRYLFILFLSFLDVVRKKPDTIITRDIGVAFFYQLFRYNVYYESHKQFTTRIGKYIFSLVKDKVYIIVNCAALKSFLIEEYFLDPARILVAHNGVDIEQVNIFDQKNKSVDSLGFIKKRPKLVIYTGSCQKGKGVEIIVVLAQLLPHIGFMIVGCKKDEIVCMGLTIPDNLEIVPFQPQERLRRLVSLADLLILPNTDEKKEYSSFTSPIKLFEYMASEKPIFASKVGAIQEVLNDENAFLFNPNDDLQIIANHLDFIFTDESSLRKKAKQAHGDVMRYTWKKRAEKILKFIESVS